jgi:hypothetical protein
VALTSSSEDRNTPVLERRSPYLPFTFFERLMCLFTVPLEVLIFRV